MKAYKKLFDELSILSEKYNCSVNIPVKFQTGKLTFNANDIKIIHTDENKTKDILGDLNTILTDLHEIEPENKKLDVFIMIILDQGETMKVTAMIAK